MPTIPGASRKQAGLYFDKGGAVFNVQHPDFGATGLGVADDGTAIGLAIAAAGAGFTEFPSGTYLTAALATLHEIAPLNTKRNVFS